MTFESTIWLFLAPVFALLAAGILLFGSRRRDALLSKFAAARLLPQLTERADSRRVLIKALCIILAVVFVVVALARPQLGVEWTERKARGLDIVFVLDSSKSMLATDLRPTRLERAKLAIRDLVRQLESDRIGLVAFAGRAFLQTPPTLDYSAFRESLDSVEPSIMTRGGSDIGNALLEAAKAFPADNNFKVVVLLTDGEDLGGAAIESARQAAEEGIRVYAIGIGTSEGEYLRILTEDGNEEFVRDNSGQPIRSQLDEATLSEIAQITGGSYTRLSDQSLNALYNSVIATLPRSERESELQEVRIERFQWLLSAAVLFLVMEILIRRRALTQVSVCIIVLFALATPSPTKAQVEEALLEEPAPVEPEAPLSSDARILYNEATEALKTGDYEAAERIFNEAIKRTEDRELQRDALYNQAHAVNQRAEAELSAQNLESAIELWKEAEALFKSAQEIDPSDTHASDDASLVAARREALEAFLEEQQPPESQDDQDSQESEDGESSEDQSEDQSGDDQQGGEQDNQENESDQGEQNSSEDGSDSEDGQSDEGSESADSESESSQSGDSSEEESEGESEQDGTSQNGEESDEQAQSSTQDPVDDIPEPGEQEAGEDEGDDGSEGATPEPNSQGEEGAEQGGPTYGTNQVIEGMSEADARALLDSLQSSERQLPFVEQTRPGNRREIRDW